MPLTNAAIKAAQPQAKPYKLADKKGMYLEVAPSGGKWWRLKYRIEGMKKRISLGTYPDVGLKEAREKREEARKLLAAGIDSGESRKAQNVVLPVKLTRVLQLKLSPFATPYLAGSSPSAP